MRSLSGRGRGARKRTRPLPGSAWSKSVQQTVGWEVATGSAPAGPAVSANVATTPRVARARRAAERMAVNVFMVCPPWRGRMVMCAAPDMHTLGAVCGPAIRVTTEFRVVWRGSGRRRARPLLRHAGTTGRAGARLRLGAHQHGDAGAVVALVALGDDIERVCPRQRRQGAVGRRDGHLDLPADVRARRQFVEA